MQKPAQGHSQAGAHKVQNHPMIQYDLIRSNELSGLTC